jgi:hypothetical protein
MSAPEGATNKRRLSARVLVGTRRAANERATEGASNKAH